MGRIYGGSVHAKDYYCSWAGFVFVSFCKKKNSVVPVKNVVLFMVSVVSMRVSTSIFGFKVYLFILKEHT